MIDQPGLSHWLLLSALLFSIGVYGILTRKNAIGILMSVELALNAGALNFVIFNHFGMKATFDGAIMALFVMTVAAAEVVVGISIFVALFKERKSVDVTQMEQLRN